MSRRLSVLAVFVLVSMMLSSVAYAQTEFTNGVIAFPYSFFTEPLDPKIACSDDNTKCMAVYYEHNTLSSRGLKLKYSTGVGGVHFQNLAYSCGGLGGWWDAIFGGCTEVGTISVDYSDHFNFMEYYSFPFDITYDEVSQKFWGVNKNTIFSYNSTDGFTASEYSLGSYKWGLQFINDTSLFAIYTIQNGDTTNSWEVRNVVTQSTVNSGKTLSTGGCSGSGGVPYNTERMMGFAMSSDGDTPYYRVRYGYNAQNCSAQTSLGSFGDSYTALDFYDGGYIYYQKGTNSSWRALSSDLSSFSYSQVFQWDDTIAQEFPHVDAGYNDFNRVFLLEQESNATPVSGIYAHNLPLYSVQVLAKGLNIDDGASDSLSVTTNIACEAENYSDSAVGVNQILTTPCLVNNLLSMSISGWQPTYVLDSDFDILSTTGYTYVRVPISNLGWVNDYAHEIRVYDSFNFEPISGASVTVGLDTVITGGNGSAIFTLAPYQNATFSRSSSANAYYYALSGVPAIYAYDISASGFLPFSDTFSLTSSTNPVTVLDFDTYTNIYLNPLHARVTVRVFTADGVEVTSNLVTVTASGAQNQTYVEIGGVTTEISYATVFPAIFILADDRSSWTASFNLTQGAYTDSYALSVTNTTYYYSVDFYLPNSSVEQACTVDAHCLDSFCKGSIWYSDGTCQSGTCFYGIDSCLLCDDEAGCYDATTTETCPTGLDFECIDSNECIDSKNLKSYKCSSSDLCVWELVECDYVCSDDVCVPSVPVVVCDQSTVVGMLTCLQSGMMGFIGSTYDPMMTIGIALGLVILITAIFALGFRAVGNVIR